MYTQNRSVSIRCTYSHRLGADRQAVTITPEPASIPDVPSTQEGSIDIQFPRTRVSVRGRVDLDVLQTVLATLRQR